MITLDEATVERVEKAFIDRIEKKKLKYAAELEELQAKGSVNNVVDLASYKR